MKRDQDWDSMKHTAFSYSFTPKEFYFFLFKKPKCPDCGEKMLRQKVKYYYYTYTCPKCGKKYTLSELAK